ncbi:MAG: ATP-grasp domain-containing protein [Spirochaetes bacterium]|nr:ATP-grasp domain-containing protein [Spirochaetota bacterium]
MFVSIGGGINQIPLIKEAKNLGLQVIGVDKNITAAGIPLCDIRIQESIENYNHIYTKLKELLVDGEITGVLTKSFGPAIKTTSYISNQLNIPLLPHSRVDDFIKKDRMKAVFKENGIHSPEFFVYSKKNQKDKKLSKLFPIIVKPVTGHAKNDVEMIKDQSKFNIYINNTSEKKNAVLIEKYINGDEIIVMGIVHNKKFYPVEITDKKKTPLPYFVDIMHTSPSKYLHLRNQIEEIGQNIADSFEIETSPLLMELIIDENDKISVIEIAPEFGGEFLADILIPESTGYNFIRETIKAVTNNNFNPPAFKKNKNAVVVKYITGTKGNLLSFNPLPNKSSGIIYSKIFKDIGSAIRKPVNNHDRIGVIITKGKNLNDALDISGKAEEMMNIRIENQ